MLEINRNPSRRELVVFVVLLGLFAALLGTVLAWKVGLAAGLWAWGVGGALTAACAALPALRRPVYLAWMYAAFPIGWTISHVLMALIYYGLFTPIGLIMRLAGRDPMHRRFEDGSYWVEHDPGAGGPERYFRQF